MKKVILLSSIFFTWAVFSHEVELYNSTDSDMMLNVSFGLDCICSPAVWVVKAKSRIVRDVGGCCAEPVKMTGIAGALNQKTFTYSPPTTGFGLSCMSWTAEIKPLANGFYAETIRY